MSAELAAVIFLLRMFDTRQLRARSQTKRRQHDQARIKTNAAYASVEALKRKLNELTDEEWNRFRWFGMPSRLRDDQLQ